MLPPCRPASVTAWLAGFAPFLSTLFYFKCTSLSSLLVPCVIVSLSCCSASACPPCLRTETSPWNKLQVALGWEWEREQLCLGLDTEAPRPGGREKPAVGAPCRTSQPSQLPFRFRQSRGPCNPASPASENEYHPPEMGHLFS